MWGEDNRYEKRTDEHLLLNIYCWFKNKFLNRVFHFLNNIFWISLMFKHYFLTYLH